MYNTKEQHCRRQLKKNGYRLVKCRDLVDHPVTYPGGYMIVDSNNFIVAGGHQGLWYEQLTLPEVEAWIAEGE